MSGHEQQPADDESARRAASEEAAWAEIVANFGARITLDDTPAVPASSESAASAAPSPAPESGTPEPSARDAVAGEVVLPDPEAFADPDPVETSARVAAERADGFNPPPLPPVTRSTGLRVAAWCVPGLVAVLFFALGLSNVAIGVMIGWLAVGFLAIVNGNSRAPRDPWDDGSRV